MAHSLTWRSLGWLFLLTAAIWRSVAYAGSEPYTVCEDDFSGAECRLRVDCKRLLILEEKLATITDQPAARSRDCQGFTDARAEVDPFILVDTAPIVMVGNAAQRPNDNNSHVEGSNSNEGGAGGLPAAEDGFHPSGGQESLRPGSTSEESSITISHPNYPDPQTEAESQAPPSAESKPLDDRNNLAGRVSPKGELAPEGQSDESKDDLKSVFEASSSDNQDLVNRCLTSLGGCGELDQPREQPPDSSHEFEVVSFPLCERLLNYLSVERPESAPDQMQARLASCRRRSHLFSGYALGRYTVDETEGGHAEVELMRQMIERFVGTQRIRIPPGSFIAILGTADETPFAANRHDLPISAEELETCFWNSKGGLTKRPPPITHNQKTDPAILNNEILPYVRAHFAKEFLTQTGFLRPGMETCLFGAVVPSGPAQETHNIPENRAVSVFFVRPKK